MSASLKTSSRTADASTNPIPVANAPPSVSRNDSVPKAAIASVNFSRMDTGSIIANKDELESRLKDLLTGKANPKDCEVRLRCNRTLKHMDYSPHYEAITNAGRWVSRLTA